MYSRDKRLFRDHKLDGYLRQRTVDLEVEIRGLALEKIREVGDDVLTQQLISKYRATIPILDEANLTIDAQECTVQVRDHFSSRFDGGGFVSVPGHSINVSIPFSGSGELFKYTPSTWSPSGTPDATVGSSSLVLHYETSEKDPEKIKGLWRSDISTIKQNLSWIEEDLSNYNTSIESNLRAALNRRKKEAEESRSLINKLME